MILTNIKAVIRGGRWVAGVRHVTKLVQKHNHTLLVLQDEGIHNFHVRLLELIIHIQSLEIIFNCVLTMMGLY